jgi:hypothetical protein
MRCSMHLGALSTGRRIGSKANWATTSRISNPGKGSCSCWRSVRQLFLVALAAASMTGPVAAQSTAVAPPLPDTGLQADAEGAGSVTETRIGAEAFAEEPIMPALTTPQFFGPAQLTFTIATWHLRAHTGSGQPERPVEPVTKWRHTFGAERRTARWREIEAAGFAADIVGLQGVKRATDAQRLFRARTHHVVVSRQLLARSAARATGLAVFRDDAPETTALAYRRQRGVTLAGFRHFLPAKRRSNGSSNAREAPAVTVFRLRVYGKLVWIASMDLGDECSEDEKAVCLQAARIFRDFTDWAGGLSEGTAPIVMLGRWPGKLRAVLEKAGFTVVAQAATTRGKCVPKPSGILLASPASSRATRVELQTRTMPDRGNACAHIGALTLHLRSQDEAESQSAAGTLRHADRR